MSSWGGNGQKLETRLKGWEQARSLTPTGTAGERLRMAAANGDYRGVMNELDTSGIDIDAHDSMDRTALIWACHSGHTNITVQLLRGNADPCRRDRHGRTAMHYSALRNDTSTLHAILLHENVGKVINAPDKYNKSPLDLAIQQNAGSAVALLVFYGAEDKKGSARELLKLSAHRGSFAAVKVLLDKNSKDSKYGRTPLHWAVWRGEEAAAELLPQKDVDVEAQGNDGLSALHLAAGSGCDSAIRFLNRQLGADINARTKDGQTALHLACAGGYDSTAQLLIREFKADKSLRNNTSQTALQLLMIYMQVPGSLGDRFMTMHG